MCGLLVSHKVPLRERDTEEKSMPLADCLGIFTLIPEISLGGYFCSFGQKISWHILNFIGLLFQLNISGLSSSLMFVHMART